MANDRFQIYFKITATPVTSEATDTTVSTEIPLKHLK